MTDLSDDVVLSVENLSIDFRLRTHILHAVENVSFELKRGQTLCLVGESGSGKSVTARSLLQIVDSPGSIVSGRILLNNGDGVTGSNGITDIAALKPSDRAMRAIRGRRIGLIFQEPMSSLSPVHTIGSQIIEAVRLHSNLDQRAARERTIELLRGRNSEPGQDGRPLHLRVLRRHAPARHDRHGTCRQSRHSHRRRTDDGARRHHPGRNP